VAVVTTVSRKWCQLPLAYGREQSDLARSVPPAYADTDPALPVTFPANDGQKRFHGDAW
jgi:hypothetical protein